jgi:hypothetical protein
MGDMFRLINQMLNLSVHPVTSRLLKDYKNNIDADN